VVVFSLALWRYRRNWCGKPVNDDDLDLQGIVYLPDPEPEEDKPVEVSEKSQWEPHFSLSEVYRVRT